MATARESSEEEGVAEEKALEYKIDELRSFKKDLFEKARPINDELETIAKREREYVDELHRLRVDKHDKEKEKQAVKRVIELEAELKHVKCENDQLKQSLHQTTKHSKAQFQKITELENRVKSAEGKMTKVPGETEDRSAVFELQRQLRQTTELLSKTREELNETRQRLSDVRDRLTVAEQVTAATQQRALHESGNSEELQLELTLQRQSTTRTGTVQIR